MVRPMIPVNEPLLDGNEARYLAECIATGWISGEGPFVERFEEGMARLTGRRHAVAVCNGTAALHTAVAALGLEPGDQVVLPSFTIISCAAAVVRCGCTPLFVDSDPVTWNMDVNMLADLVRDEIDRKGNRRIKAIMAVHTYGLPVDLEPVLELAERYGLRVIEDAAEMLGQTCRDRACGSFGDVSTFSFYSNKHVTTGEGGMILTDDDGVASRCRSLRNLCFQPGRRFVHEELGFNYRLSNLQAAVGVAQLERLDRFVSRKRAMGKRYTELLHDLSGILLPSARTTCAENIYWVYGLVLTDRIRCDAQTVMDRLAQRGVATRPFFWPLHEQPALKRMGLASKRALPVAEALARRGFYLPSGLALTEEQIETVAAAVVDEIRAHA